MLRSNFIALLTLCLLQPPNDLWADGTAAINWRENYNEARREAETTEKPLLIYCEREHSFWCEKFTEKVLYDKRVSAFVNSRFVSVRINASTNPKLAEVLRFEFFPSTIIAAKDGKILGSIVGYASPELLCERIQRMLRDANIPTADLPDFPKEEPVRNEEAPINRNPF